MTISDFTTYPLKAKYSSKVEPYYKPWLVMAWRLALIEWIRKRQDDRREAADRQHV